MAGKSVEMSLTNNLTTQLWGAFMPLKKELQGLTDNKLYSVEVYPGLDYFNKFSPHNTFIKWAAVEVEPAFSIPELFDELIIPSGCYAVIFVYRITSRRACFLR